jgi:hypothetical protein
MQGWPLSTLCCVARSCFELWASKQAKRENGSFSSSRNLQTPGFLFGLKIGL